MPRGYKKKLIIIIIIIINKIIIIIIIVISRTMVIRAHFYHLRSGDMIKLVELNELNFCVKRKKWICNHEIILIATTI